MPVPLRGPRISKREQWPSHWKGGHEGIHRKSLCEQPAAGVGVAADAPPPGPLQATLGFDIIPGPTRASSCSGPDNPAHDAQKWSLARPRCPVCDRGLFRCFRGKLEPEPIAPLGLASSLLPVLRQSQEEGGTDQAGGSAVTYRHATDVRSPSEVKKKKEKKI